MSEEKDFVDVVKPILQAGTWTNYGATPPIIDASVFNTRYNKNKCILISNDEVNGPPYQTFDGGVQYQNLKGSIIAMHTNNIKRNKLKKDILAILKDSGLAYRITSGRDTPKNRNKQYGGFFLTLIN